MRTRIRLRIPILAASSRTKVLVLSADPDTEGIRQALHAGASGYLSKDRAPEELIQPQPDGSPSPSFP